MALFYTKGTLSQIGEVKSGTSKNGNPWSSMTILLDVPGYQGTITKISFNVSGDRISDIMEHKVGDKVEIGWSIYAREWNGKWYNSVDLINIKAQDTPAHTAAPASAPQGNFSQSELDPSQHNDLPW